MLTVDRRACPAPACAAAAPATWPPSASIAVAVGAVAREVVQCAELDAPQDVRSRAERCRVSTSRRPDAPGRAPGARSTAEADPGPRSHRAPCPVSVRCTDRIVGVAVRSPLRDRIQPLAESRSVAHATAPARRATVRGREHLELSNPLARRLAARSRNRCCGAGRCCPSSTASTNVSSSRELRSPWLTSATSAIYTPGRVRRTRCRKNTPTVAARPLGRLPGSHRR